MNTPPFLVSLLPIIARAASQLQAFTGKGLAPRHAGKHPLRREATCHSLTTLTQNIKARP
ncbi:hypothetical protein GCM10011342_18750 [Aquisalinus flavus]|uniref:Uncharacterized protein n=1 Tax=Aquisalinus flavus TaxID=1526572 RepID=A0A8J2V5C0_9PROT|nr:hypothetical protein GCM10011342_18750 [Aquisalinus flavus]